jgi:signal transduction histidine kinase
MVCWVTENSSGKTYLRYFGWLLALCTILWHPSAQADTPIHFTSAELLSIDGIGFSPPPDSINAADLHGEWMPVALPHVLPRQLIPTAEPGDIMSDQKTVVNWYRVHVPAMSTAPKSAATPSYFYIPRWKTIGQIAVYGDQRLLYQSHASLLWNGRNHPLWIPVNDTSGAVPPKTILLRIESLRSSGSAISTVWLGDEQSIGWRYTLRNLLQIEIPFMSSAAFLAVGLFSLCVWLKQRNEPLYLMFFCTSLTAYLHSMIYYVGLNRLPISDQWFGWLAVDSMCWMVASSHFFLVSVHRRPQPWLNRAVIGITAGITIVTLPFLTSLPGVANWLTPFLLSPLFFVLMFVMGFGAFSCDLYSSWRVKSSDGILLAGWSVLVSLISTYDFLLVNNFVSVESGFVSPYLSGGSFFISVYIMLHRYIGAIDEVKQVNATLEQRVQLREDELVANHQRLRESEEFLKEAQLIAGLGSYVLDISSGYWIGTDTIDRMFGIDESYEKTYEAWAKLVHPDDHAMITGYFESLIFAQDKVFDKEYRIIRPDNQAVRYLYGLGRLSFDAQGLPLKMLGTIQDITEQREREHELAASYERLREIEHRQTLSQERQRLMQDMHDGLGSSLVSALRVVERGKMDEADIAQVLKGCIDDLKLAIDSMEPVEADLLLLLATLRFRLGPRLESTGIALLWQVTNVPALDWLDPKNALHILRILQEVFTNIIKHTEATEIRVATGVEDNYVRVTITDNGQGFSVEHELKSAGKGLSNQMRRADSIGAKVNWNSDDAGTCFTLRLPIKR